MNGLEVCVCALKGARSRNCTHSSTDFEWVLIFVQTSDTTNVLIVNRFKCVRFIYIYGVQCVPLFVCSASSVCHSAYNIETLLRRGYYTKWTIKTVEMKRHREMPMRNWLIYSWQYDCNKLFNKIERNDKTWAWKTTLPTHTHTATAQHIGHDNSMFRWYRIQVG